MMMKRNMSIEIRLTPSLNVNLHTMHEQHSAAMLRMRKGMDDGRKSDIGAHLNRSNQTPNYPSTHPTAHQPPNHG